MERDKTIEQIEKIATDYLLRPSRNKNSFAVKVAKRYIEAIKELINNGYDSKNSFINSYEDEYGKEFQL
jgi:hypothetical protein